MVCIYVELDAGEVWPASAWVGFAKDVWVTSTLVSQGVRLQPSPISSKDPTLESRKKNDLSIRWKNHRTLFQVHPRDGLKGPSIVISSRHEVAGSFKAVNQPAQCIAKSLIQLGTGQELRPPIRTVQSIRCSLLPDELQR